MQSQVDYTVGSGEFLLRKSVFLLTSSVGMTMAETLMKKALEQIGRTPDTLMRTDIPKLAESLEPALSEFVGNEKAGKLVSALRVLVGGMTRV